MKSINYSLLMLVCSLSSSQLRSCDVKSAGLALGALMSASVLNDIWQVVPTERSNSITFSSTRTSNGQTRIFQLSLAPSIGYRTFTTTRYGITSEQKIGVWLSDNGDKDSFNDRMLASIPAAAFLCYVTLHLIK